MIVVLRGKSCITYNDHFKGVADAVAELGKGMLNAISTIPSEYATGIQLPHGMDIDQFPGDLERIMKNNGQSDTDFSISVKPEEQARQEISSANLRCIETLCYQDTFHNN